MGIFFSFYINEQSMMKVANTLLYVWVPVPLLTFCHLNFRLYCAYLIFTILNNSIQICILTFHIVSWSGKGGKGSYLKRLITIMPAYCVSRTVALKVFTRLAQEKH
ncbi:hypothetical protein AAZV13_07G082800 [Glycine max]